MQGESNSISNQKQYLEEYAERQGLRNIRHFSDDGYSGTNFNRPGFNELLAEIEAGHVSTVIVKDMSRFGRNYLQVGYYTEMKFPQKGVRFIAINNGVDSAKPQDNDFTPFLNIMNEWYAKDTSNKIKAVFKQRMSNGLRCSGSIPYGYRRMPGDKQTLHVDEESAAVVRRIFDMACNGKQMGEIVKTLTEEKVLIPAAYLERQHPEQARNHAYYDCYAWNYTTVNTILNRQEYLGHTVLCKTVCDNFKTKKRRNATPEEMMIFPDTHEAIIDQDTWDKAHKHLNRKIARVASGTYTHRLLGMAYCADCGGRMLYSRPPEGSPYRESSAAFQCVNYRNRSSCPSHYVKASTLEKVALASIKAISAQILSDEEAFVSELVTQWEQQQDRACGEESRALAKAERRMDELDALIKSIYENQINGSLPERQSKRLILQYDSEQEQLEKQIESLKATIGSTEVKKTNPKKFVALVKKYKDCEELTDEMLYDFIDKISVHAPQNGRTKYRTQQIDVHFNFIGDYQLPQIDDDMSEEERRAAIDAECRARKKAQRKVKDEERAAKLKALKLAAETDPEAAAEYEEIHKKLLEQGRRAREKAKEKKQNDPEYRRIQAEKQAIRIQKQSEKQKHTRAALIERAKTDPKAAEELAEIRAKGAEKSRREREKRAKRAAEDPEYAAKMAEKTAEYNRRHTAQRQAARAELIERAKTDPKAAEELAEIRAKGRDAARRSMEKKKALAAENPEYAAKLEEKRVNDIRKHTAYQKAKREDLIERAKTDPKAAEELAERRAKQVREVQKSNAKKKALAAENPEYAAELDAKRIEANRKKNERAKEKWQELLERAKTDPKAAEEVAERRAKAVKATQRCQAKKKAQQEELSA
jgi:hypothetical protein